MGHTYLTARHVLALSMASNVVERASVSFHQATKVERLDSHTYRVNLRDTFRIGAGTSQTHLISSHRTPSLWGNMPYLVV